MINTFNIFFTVALAMLSFSFTEPRQAEAPPQPAPIVDAPVALDTTYTARGIELFNLKTGTVSAEYHPDDQLPIASITKIMTGYIALQTFSPDDPITVSQNAIATDGSVGHFQAGEEFRTKDLITAMMTASSNDAAVALAEAIGKNAGEETFEGRMRFFVDRMNQTAKKLGMNSTTYLNPSGLDAKVGIASNYSTANDLKLLIKATYRETPILWDLSRPPQAKIVSLQGTAHSLVNINTLAGHIPNFIGSKTGSTDTARESVVILFEEPLGNPRCLILLGADPGGARFLEAEKIISAVTTVLP